MSITARRHRFACPVEPLASTPAAKTAPQAGFLRRALAAAIDAVMDMCERRAERDMARLLGRTGGLLTDDVERRATRRCRD